MKFKLYYNRKYLTTLVSLFAVALTSTVRLLSFEANVAVFETSSKLLSGAARMIPVSAVWEPS